MKGYSKTAVLTSTVERRLQDAALPEKILKRKKKRTRLPLAVLPPQTNFHLLLAGLRYEAFSLLCESFTEGKHPGVTLQIPFKVPVWNLRGVCFSDFSRWCIFLSCLVIIKARLCCSIERIIHC